MPRSFAATAIALCLLALLTAASAQAKPVVYKGKSSQGQRATYYERKSGDFEFFSIRWRARCDKGPNLLTQTGFDQPIDRLGPNGFRDAGRYALRDGRLKYVFNVGVKGKRVSGRRLKGTFRGSIDVFRRHGGDGRVDRCRAKSIRWSVKRR